MGAFYREIIFTEGLSDAFYMIFSMPRKSFLEEGSFFKVFYTNKTYQGPPIPRKPFRGLQNKEILLEVLYIQKIFHKVF